MSDIEKLKLIQLLIEQREETSSRERDALQKRVAELDVNSRRMEGLMDQICELTRFLKEKENTKLQSRLDVANRKKYDKTSQKKSGSCN